MPENPSPNGQHKPPEGDELSAKQLTALESLLLGTSVTGAAAAAGVDRSTVHAWLRENFAFQAALNGGRKERRAAVSHRLEVLADDATKCVTEAVRQGNLKAALALLRGLDLLTPGSLGSDDPAELRLKAAERRNWRKTRQGIIGDSRDAGSERP
jgi:hypothetical protein